MRMIRHYISALQWRISFLIASLIVARKKQIIFSSYYGKGYGDNPKYIAEAIHRIRPDLKLLWVVEDDKVKESLPDYIVPLRKHSFEYFVAMNQSYVYIDNCRSFIPRTRKRLFYIQTWHGGGGQKKCESDVAGKLDKGYVKGAIKDSKRTDLMISDSRFMTDLYHSSFWYDGPVFEAGYPRYDVITQNPDCLRSKVCKFYSIDEGKGIAIYAPTFRADYSLRAYSIDFKILVRSLEKRFGKEFVVLVRLHPNISELAEQLVCDSEGIINVSHYPDSQELLVAADLLIGDYSSINYDFCLSGKPVIRYVSDLDDYKNDRDFYFGFEDYPFPFARNNEELQQLILGFDEEKYRLSLNEFFGRIGACRRCDSSDVVARLIIEYLDSGLGKDEFIRQKKGMFVY